MKNSSQENGEGAIIVPSPFSHKRCWQICDNGHEWETTYARITRKNGCPYCTNKKVLSGYNDVKSRFPKISQQWNYEKNPLQPTQVLYGSHKKVWWICDKGHEWEAMIKERTIFHKNCPYCAGQKVLQGFNDIVTTHPAIIKEWNYTKNTNFPEFYNAGSRKKVWWVCDKGHEWEAIIKSRCLQNKKCPYCTGRKVLSGYNDLMTTHPYLIREWNYRKNTLNPANISKGSNKKVWWVCDKGHEWEAMINSRTRINKTNCPVCMRSFVSSAQEKELLNFLKSLTNYLIIENSRSIIAPYELDIYIPKLNIAFEFNGTYWHSDQQIMKNHNMTAKEYHTMKTMLCSKENIQLFHITEYDWLNNKDMVEAYIRSVLR